jgi:hypothetical protein
LQFVTPKANGLAGVGEVRFKVSTTRRELCAGRELAYGVYRFPRPPARETLIKVREAFEREIMKPTSAHLGKFARRRGPAAE